MSASDDRHPSRRTSFLDLSSSPSTSNSPEFSTTGDGRRDLAIAVDGSFVETTSEAAARSMARFYSAQEGERGIKVEYAVQKRVDKDGRTLYRIRPLSAHTASTSPPSSSESLQSEHPFARPSTQPPGPVVSVPSLEHPGKIDETSQSSSFADDPSLLHLSPGRPAVRKAGSTPILRNNLDSESGYPARAIQSSSQLSSSASTSHLNATLRKSRHSSQGDVLGRILGWREEVTDRESEENAGGRTIRKTSQSARVPLPELFGRGSDSPTRKKKSKKESRELDTSDLPQDLVEVLADKAGDQQAQFPSVFGSEVRVPRMNFSSDPLPPSSTSSLQVQPAASKSTQERTMREVASNDSIRTARADDPPLSQPNDFSHRPRFQDPRVFDVFHAQPSPPPSSPPVLAPSSSTPHGQHARFPSSSSLASSASGHSNKTGQQITVHPNPGDDPRFVIWGYKESSQPAVKVPPSSTTIATSRRPSIASPPLVTDLRRGSIADSNESYPSPSTSASGSPATTSSRRWSLSARGGGGGGIATNGSGYASPATSVRDSVGSSGGGSSSQAQRILMAATVERLIAELTSQISVELLSDFFLTFRHYLSPLDLLHLLLTRFDWAMSPSSTVEDDALRRVVRVRTFVVIRYWLLNHFMDDFYPSKEMRSTLTDWLNQSAKDQRFRENQKDARLIKNLKKTVRKCKETFVLGRPQHGGGGGSEGTTVRIAEPRLSEEDVDLEMVDSALRGVASKSPPPSSSTSNSFKFGTFGRSRKNSTIPPAQSLSASTSSSSSEPAFPLPGTPQNPIARSFASALGTFGRFKRMIGQRATSNPGPGGSGGGGGEDGGNDVEFEQSVMGDLLWVKGGLERYLEYWDIKKEPQGEEEENEPERVVEGLPEVVIDEPTIDDATTPKINQTAPQDVSISESTAEPASTSEQVGLGILARPPAAQDPPPPGATLPSSTDYSFPPLKPIDPPALLPIFDPETYTSGVTSLSTPFGRPASTRIELDDLDDSDEDDEDVVEVKRTLKRLPNAHNLRLAATTAPLTPQSVRSSLESETSYGFGTGPRLSYGGQERESVLFVDDEEGQEAGVAVIPNFILEGLLDSEDEDEPGDVEAALRRLEGLVDTSKEQEKAKKVERQMQKSEKLEREKLKENETDSSPSTSLGSERPSIAAQTSEDEAVAPPTKDPVSTPPPREIAVVEPESVEVIPVEATEPLVPFSSQTSPPISSTPDPLESVALRSPQKPTRVPSRLGVNPAYPTIAGRKATLSRIFGGASQARPASSLSPPSPNPPPPTHRSFLLFCRTETLAQQFTLIERDMLRMLSYQELVSGSWRTRIGETDVLDWEQYLKERRREDLIARERGEQVMSAVQDVITRFNLMANWVASEILLTANIDERAILIGKFIRFAFICYCQSNFQTVMQIVHGLQVPHVERLRKTWAKVPSWEIRKLEGMQRFISHLKNFTHLRDLMNRLAAEYSPGVERTSLSDPVAGLALKGCIPFVGLFLRDLALNSELPTFLDPTSTNTPASVDSAGSLTSLAEPLAFESLSPLPDNVDLFPLVNLHKFRKLATIVQRVRTFQALSERYTFEPAQNVYFKCLKIRSLDQVVMQELSSRLEP
ncbi:mitotic regulator LTE1 [Sporobolomyces salmoneus]|uniref:mitotic regulator LTE1 n=1 Tax=Sporobolomyces salmoneus TaxID=183962 RepID=UPI0031784225